jgi:hypothetical protein
MFLVNPKAFRTGIASFFIPTGAAAATTVYSYCGAELSAPGLNGV